MKTHPDSPGVRWSIARWLKAPGQRPDGTLVDREQGTPHGGVSSPRRAHRCWQYPFEVWRPRPHPAIAVEPDAEAPVGPCRSAAQAQRFAVGWLEWQPQKTKVVAGKEEDRRGTEPNARFDCLG